MTKKLKWNIPKAKDMNKEVYAAVDCTPGSAPGGACNAGTSVVSLPCVNGSGPASSCTGGISATSGSCSGGTSPIS